MLEFWLILLVNIGLFNGNGSSFLSLRTVIASEAKQSVSHCERSEANPSEAKQTRAKRSKPERSEANPNAVKQTRTQ